VNFSQQPPSKQWAVLKFRGEKFAEVWFKPEGQPFSLTFRIPQESFQLPGMGKQLTVETLLKAVTIPPEEVESWCHGDVSEAGGNGANPELKTVLPPPPQDAGPVMIHVRLRPPPEAVASLSPAAKGEGEGESSEPEISPALWQDLEAHWKNILGMEAAIDTVRISLEGVLKELESLLKKTLTPEEKTYAPRADLSNWERARKRVPFALPKIRDFIHRSVWVVGAPERKRLEEIYKEHIEPKIPFPQMNEVLKQMAEVQKDRQTLSANGQAVYQESKGISADVQGALRTLQSNAVANARKHRDASKGGKFFKDVRRMSGI
jgi:hypothetical protein